MEQRVPVEWDTVGKIPGVVLASSHYLGGGEQGVHFDEPPTDMLVGVRWHPLQERDQLIRVPVE
eukprot:7091406-Heterocapsa_arctica.AAC.1